MESREIKIPDFLRRENEKPLSKENETFLRLRDEHEKNFIRIFQRQDFHIPFIRKYGLLSWSIV